MKLTTVTGTYAPTISNGTNNTEDFTNYHAVPDTYTKVATYNNATDVGTGATGLSLRTIVPSFTTPLWVVAASARPMIMVIGFTDLASAA